MAYRELAILVTIPADPSGSRCGSSPATATATTTRNGFRALRALRAADAAGLGATSLRSLPQGIEDGELVDVSTTAAEAGFRVPVAMTRRHGPTTWRGARPTTTASTPAKTKPVGCGTCSGWPSLPQSGRAAAVAPTTSCCVYRVKAAARGAGPTHPASRSSPSWEPGKN